MMKELKVSCEIDPATYQATGKYVLVKREKVEEKTAGGIVLPDSIRKQTSHCYFVQAGPQSDDEVKAIVPGSKVYLHGHVMVQKRFGWEGEVYDVIYDEDIIAVEVKGGA
jgi:co-chaperonin GroES (HSP10)